MINDNTNDEREIVALLSRFARILDHREWARFDQVFTTDATAYGAPQVGLDAIVEHVQGFLGGCGPSHHLLGNFDIRVDGDTATGLTGIRAMHQGAGDRADDYYEVLGDYHDQFRRGELGWRIASRTIAVRVHVGDRSVLRRG